ncbi:MAG TPA: DinB family protein [Acidimicrobiales bacterium]|nr:DinB family protein [Acidimicrobiales bacterium]
MVAGNWDVPRPGWTCAECGFSFDAFDPKSIGESMPKVGKRLRAPLTRGLPNEDLLTVLRTRPQPDQWSALEYACHVRDALCINIERVTATLTDDSPEFQTFGRDEAVVERNYNQQNPAQVADDIDAAAVDLAAAFAAVPDDAWQRFWVRGDMNFSIDWMARNVQHEVDHHLLDIGRTLRHVRGR